jgi:RNA polymerase sigma-70 factor (ECF subfamily)
MRPQNEPLDATSSTLLRRVRDFGDAKSWDEFDKLYRPMLVKYARRRHLPPDVAEEIAQQCLAAIVSRIGKFERKTSFRGWLRGMVDHKIADYFARWDRERQADTDVLRNARDLGPTSVELWEESWDQAHVFHLVGALRTNFARHTLQAFSLYVLQERPVREIGQVLGMTPNQIYVAKSRVIRFIRERFGHVVDSLYGATL